MAFYCSQNIHILLNFNNLGHFWKAHCLGCWNMSKIIWSRLNLTEIWPIQNESWIKTWMTWSNNLILLIFLEAHASQYLGFSACPPVCSSYIDITTTKSWNLQFPNGNYVLQTVYTMGIVGKHDWAIPHSGLLQFPQCYRCLFQCIWNWDCYKKAYNLTPCKFWRCMPPNT